MHIEVWTMYVVTVLAMMSTPGPSHLLMLSNSMAHGFRRSLATVAGDLTANLLQMLAAGLGLAALLTVYGNALVIIKWLGVAYLIFLGIRIIRNAGTQNADSQEAAPASAGKLWLQGFITSATNPKAIVFFAALFPQFISADGAFWPQFIILSITYIVIDGLFLCAYGMGASWIANRFTGSTRTTIEKTGGGLMLGAAVLLGLKTLSD
ncbi:MAG: LysE family translocator [Proteobacteria bacterium]|nr:LysE family translocator [Pseudomonadota bacterium]